MGVMPVAKLLLTMSVPMMISMLVQALYNIVDSMFVARLSESALTAVSLAFPVQNLMIAVGTGTGVGINALVSRSLGEKKQEYANSAANNGIYLGICNCLWIFCTCFFQGADYGSADHGIWCGLCQSDRNYVLRPVYPADL